MNWTAEITNDPSRNFELYIELIEGETYRARIQRNPEGQLELHVYGTEPFSIPAEWLAEMLSRASTDLRHITNP
jgi:hypothetical protein